MAEFKYDAVHAITPAAVADSMIDLVEQGGYPGGTVLEVTAAGRRVIPAWNIDPPAATKEAESGGDRKKEESQGDYGRILGILDGERDVGM